MNKNIEQYYVVHDYALDQLKKNLDQMIKEGRFNNRFIVVFGVNKITAIITEYLKGQNIDIHAIIDNDKAKHEYIIDGIKICAPEKILSTYRTDALILIASSYQDEMMAQLEALNYFEGEQSIKVIDLPKLMNDYSYVNRQDYKVMKMDEVKKRQIKLLKLLKQVCDENDIEYFLGYGTLLGSVRHEGYIPWDDDIDVLVWGKDFRRLAKIINSRYEIGIMVNCFEHKRYQDQVGILIDYDSIMDFNLFPLQATTGVGIDIFPLFGIPEGIEEKQEYIETVKKLEMTKWRELGSHSNCHNATIKLFNYMASFNTEKCNEVGYILSPYFVKDILSKKIFTSTVKVKFEDEEYNAPIMYKEYLSQIYGNYMELPPIKKRQKARHYYRAYFKPNRVLHNEENKRYWDSYYREIEIKVDPSNFAQEVAKYLNRNGTLIDLGCGNGRDSLYFEMQELNIIAIDLSEVVIEELSKQYKDYKNLRFVCGDFTKLEEIVQEQVEYCYSRFTIHAITERQQDDLLNSVYEVLKEDGLFFIEVRSVNDEIYSMGECVGRNAYIYNGHYRRFIVKEELKEVLKEKGFEVIYDAERRGFAPYGGSDPSIIRMIAKKGNRK